ncbi:hypothetical protein [Vibrio sp. Hal054]|uniref:hypothetical protein n=1 Tax=Vibrio sp. Hal054 TaxID=3035158 RepID=UPI00301D7C8A
MSTTPNFDALFQHATPTEHRQDKAQLVCNLREQYWKNQATLCPSITRLEGAPDFTNLFAQIKQADETQHSSNKVAIIRCLRQRHWAKHFAELRQQAHVLPEAERSAWLEALEQEESL